MHVTLEATRMGSHPPVLVSAFSTVSVEVSPLRWLGVVLLSLWWVRVGNAGCVQSTHTTSLRLFLALRLYGTNL